MACRPGLLAFPGLVDSEPMDYSPYEYLLFERRDRGVLLVRRVVPNAEAFPAIDAVRHHASAEPR